MVKPSHEYPERIFLERENSEIEPDDCTAWLEERFCPSDVEYIRGDTVEPSGNRVLAELRSERDAALKQVDTLYAQLERARKFLRPLCRITKSNRLDFLNLIRIRNSLGSAYRMPDQGSRVN